MLVGLKTILNKAQNGHYAVPQFNVSNLESIRAVVAAAEKLKSPVIVAVTEGAIKHAGIEYLSAIFSVSLYKSKIPMALHLDHGKSFEICEQAIKWGFSSVMIDASALSFEKNISLTRRVVEIAHPKKVSVEGELGQLLGVEENIKVSARQKLLTDPAQAAKFVKETAIDALAVSVGTTHGVYKFKGAPKLDIKRLEEIKEFVKIPLVLHGASEIDQKIVRTAKKYGAEIKGAKGVPRTELKKAINRGVAKVNTDSDLNLASVAALRRELCANPNNVKLYKVLEPAYDAYYKEALARIKICGSVGKA